MNKSKAPGFFSATVLIYKDGTLAIMDSDIKGLFIQVDTFHELLVETRWVASELLELTSEFSPEYIAESTLHLNFEFVMEEEPRLETVPLDLSLPILLGNKKIIQSLQPA